MPFVPVPKDLSKVKTKVALNLTKRQLICLSIAGVIGIPTYLLTRTIIGNDVAVILMIALMLPCFFLAMYEKDGMPAEKILDFLHNLPLHIKVAQTTNQSKPQTKTSSTVTITFGKDFESLNKPDYVFVNGTVRRHPTIKLSLVFCEFMLLSFLVWQYRI